jgi:hypothetical protein
MKLKGCSRSKYWKREGYGFDTDLLTSLVLVLALYAAYKVVLVRSNKMNQIFDSNRPGFISMREVPDLNPEKLFGADPKSLPW